jgi:hypothetical protein
MPSGECLRLLDEIVHALTVSSRILKVKMLMRSILQCPGRSHIGAAFGARDDPFGNSP